MNEALRFVEHGFAVPPRRITFMNPAPWMDDAACAHGVDPELFHPDDDSPRAPKVIRRGIAEAKKVCGRCPVLTLCASYAMERDELSGIWGGMTSTERRRLRAGAA